MKSNPRSYSTSARKSMPKILFIINPKAGTGRKDIVENAIDNILDHSRHEASIQYTTHAGHAAEIARKTAGKADIIVAVGGDGTVNEVARSLVHTTTALGIIPAGSGNGLARHLRIPMDPAEAMKLINEACIEKLDYGRINGEAFFCTCGVGFDAFISMKFAEAGKRGLSTYIEKTLQDGLSYRPEVYRIEMDGEDETHEAFLIACANASQYGNNAYITPKASMSDGLLDVTVMEPFPLISAPQILLQMFNKSLDENSHIRSLRCRSLKILRKKPGVVHYDGDPIMIDGDLNISLVSKGINMVINANGKVKVSPILRAFTDIYSGISSGVQQIGQGMNSTGEQIKKFNNDLLNKLKN